MAEQGNEVMTQRQASDFLKLSVRSLERMRQTGEGPPFCTLGARIVYRHADLDAWLLTRRVTSTSAATVRDVRAAQ